MAKEIKLLSDGNIAKVGMIVVNDESHQIGKILYTKTGVRPKTSVSHIEVHDIYLDSKQVNYSWFCWHCVWELRKATPTERKQYYEFIKANQNG